MVIPGTKQGNWKIDYIKNKRFIYVNSHGRLNNDDITQLTTEAIKSAQKHNVNNFLLDHRELIPDLSIIDIFCIPKIGQSLGFYNRGKLAVVYSESEDFKDKFNFFDTVLFNRGYNIRLFTKIKEAEKWLDISNIK
jgi:hypothetical protein